MTRSLLVAPQWIGDAVMAQSLVALLQARGERVAALGMPAVAPVLRAMPGVDAVIEAPFHHGRLDLAARRDIAAQLRGHRFDRAYILGNNVKSRLVPWLARIPQRIGHRGEARGLLLTDAIAPPRDSSATSTRGDMRRHYAALAGAADVAALPEPTLCLSDGAADAVRARFGLPPRWIALCPGAEYGPAKQWPTEHFAALGRLALRHGLGVAVLGTARDAGAGAAIAAAAAGVTDLCGRTRLDEAIALLAGAAGVVSNDSGLMHVAAALGRPTVGLYGSTDPRHTPPAAHRSATIWLHLDCSPCFQRSCPLGHLRCLRDIAPDRVWETLETLIGSRAEGG